MWSNAADWQQAATPTGSGNSVVIDATGTAYTVSYDVASLTLSTLAIDSADAVLAFGAGDALRLTGLTSLAAGEIDLLNAGATLAVGTLVASGGTTIDIGSGASLEATGKLDLSGLLDANGGTIQASQVVLESTGTLDLTGGATLHTSGTIQVLAGAGVEIDSGASMTTGGKLAVSGVIEALSGVGSLGWSSVSGTGTIEANGGTVDLLNAISSNSGVSFDIGDTTGSVLEIGGTINSGNTISFLGPVGELALGGGGRPKLTIDGLNVGTGPTNFIDVLGTTVSVSSGGTGSGTSGNVVLSSGATLMLADITNSSGSWHVQTANDGNGGTDIYLSTVCYAAGTHILTPHGERMVEDLAPGDTVITVSGAQRHERTIRWVGRRHIDLARHEAPERVAPICIRRSAIADATPHRDLLVSPDHAILLDGKLICARQLVNGTTIRQDTTRASVTYFHVELDTHAILLAEGLPAESYLDTGNRGFFSNADVPLVLHPDLSDTSLHPSRVTSSCAPFVSDAEDVEPVWRQLAERASALGQAPQAGCFSADPALHIVVNGRTVRPLSRDNNRYVFVLPKGTSLIRLVSHASQATAARPWLEDRRRLGVYVSRVVLHSAGDVLDVPLDHPDLSNGWWAVERDAAMLRRWTNGDAWLPLPAFAEVALMEVYASSSGMAYLLDDVEQMAAA